MQHGAARCSADHRSAAECSADPALSTKACAELFGVTRHTIARWIAAGDLPAFDIGTPGRPRLRVLASAVEAFQAARRVEADLT